MGKCVWKLSRRVLIEEYGVKWGLFRFGVKEELVEDRFLNCFWRFNGN